MTTISEAFFRTCSDAVPARSSYVSLYVSTPYYGGPEEGGWWGSDTTLVAYRRCSTDEEASAVAEEVKAVAEEMSLEAKKSFGRACLSQTAWLEARGLDDNSLPEVDGEASYFIAREEQPGSLARCGDRHYS